MTDARSHMQDLVAVAAPYWAGEAEIVREYLAAHRTPERDLVWLKAQAWKETRLLRELSPDAQRDYFATNTIAEHPEGSEAVHKFAEEIKHFRLIAGLVTEITGKPVTIAELAELPEETKLQAMRAPYRHGTPFERAIVNFTEGGGGAIYWVLSRLEGGTLERHMADVFREIHDEEVWHGPAEVRTIAKRITDEADWERAARAVRAICRQRLAMRNEMFSRPLSEARLDAIAAGNIEPWPMPIDL